MVKCHHRHTSKNKYVFWMKIIQVTFEAEIFVALVTDWCSQTWFFWTFYAHFSEIFKKVYQLMFFVLFWLKIICRTEYQFSLLIRNRESIVTCMDEVCQSIKLHLNHIILVIDHPFFNLVINFFRFCYIINIIPD